MPDVFGRYGIYYDLIYQDKDYEKECDFLENIFSKYASIPIKNVFDGGCGTGGHALPLAARGFKIDGLDVSEVMIDQARRKCASAGLRLGLNIGDLRSVSSKKKYDAAICMFAVMGYFVTNNEIGEVIRNMRGMLKKDALFIFDVWNGLAVMRMLPEVRVKVAEGAGMRAIRWVYPELDSFNHMCKDHYQLIVIKGNRVIDEIAETHTVRYFFPQEIIHYIEENGFEALEICPFLHLGERVDENEWNMTVISRVRS